MMNLGNSERFFTPMQIFRSQKSSRNVYESSKYSPIESSKYGFSGKFRGPRDIMKRVELPDYENFKDAQSKYFDTIDYLKIDNRISEIWIRNTKEWIHKGIIKKLVRLDFENLKELTRKFQKLGFNIVFSKEDNFNSPFKVNFPVKTKEAMQTLDIEDLLQLNLRENLMDQLYENYYYAIKNKPLFQVDKEQKEDIEGLLTQRRDIEKYYRIDGFPKEIRAYTHHRITKMADSSSLKILYNSGESWNGAEWNSKLPTDAQIIIWLFSTCFQRMYRDDGEYKAKIKILYNYMEYHKQYNKGGNSLVIVQVAPPKYAPFYKVISGSTELNSFPAEDNVFSTAMLFMHEIKTKKKGIFGGNHKGLLDDIFRG